MTTVDKIKEQLMQIDTLVELDKPYYWTNANTIICNINGYRWIFGTISNTTLNWDDAINWCASQGGVLPPREVLLMASMNPIIHSELVANGFSTYWSSTELELNASVAWVQSVYSGWQNPHVKSQLNMAFVCRRVLINQYSSQVTVGVF
jgi:hypothetical protein